MRTSNNIEERDFIAELLADKAKFDAYVYTPINEAINELAKRESDKSIIEYCSQLPPFQLPHGTTKKFMAITRNVATPNYEMHRFAICADVLKDLEPYVLEYTEDKYAHVNELKYMLGQLHFHKGFDKNTNPIIEKKGVIDMNHANGKKFREVRTKWGQTLIDFHHEFFYSRFPHMKECHFDISLWLKNFGATAPEYYEQYLSIFLMNGILFENFLFTNGEMVLCEKVVLPAIISIEKKTGKRPLIVGLEPTKQEGDKFWNSYPPNTIDFVREKLDKI